MKQHLVITAIGCLVLLGGCGDSRTSQERWSIFPSGARYNFVRTISPRYLWMKGGGSHGQIQQYDMKERKFTVFTDRDGLPLSTNEVERLIASPDNRCLLMLERRSGLFLWEEALGWRSLPLVGEEYEVKDIAFDSDGGIIVLVTDNVRREEQTSCRILRLTFRAWQPTWEPTRTAKVPYALTVVPFDDAYIIAGYDDKHKLFRIDKSGGEPVELPGELPSEERLTYFRVAGKTYLGAPFNMMERPDLSRDHRIKVMQTVRELTPEGLVLKSKDAPQFLDLRSGTFEPMSISMLPEKKAVCRIPSIGEWEVSFWRDARIFPIVDRNGEVWMPTGTYSNGRLIPTAGSRHEVHGISAAFREMAYYDADEDRWRRAVPPEYGWFSTVGPDKKQAWVVPDHKAPTMRLMDFSGAKPRLIKEVPREEDWDLPNFQDNRGRWWMCRYNRNVVRLDPNGQTKRYPLTQPHYIWPSPKTGEIWGEARSGYYKYDPEIDEFIPAESDQFYDAFAFKIGPYEYSILPLKHGLRVSTASASCRRKVEGRWEHARSACRAGNRLLIDNDNGAWEYDDEKTRWIQLHSRPGFRVAFDSQGRRVLANADTILMYDGDPFEDPGYTRYRKLLEVQEKILVECVGLLESPDDRIREYAKLQIQGLPLIKPRIDAIIADERTPDATRALLKEALEGLSMENLPPGLFNAAYPPCPPYTIEPQESGAGRLLRP